MQTELSLNKLFGYDSNDVVMVVNSQYSAQNPEHRLTLRQQILKFLTCRAPEFLPENEADFLNLDKQPIIEGLGLSISHCKSMGGFAISFSSGHVGFDVEDVSRVSDELASRISSPEEKYPIPALQWVAKESTYKACNKLFNLTHIGQIKIDEWKESEGSYSFSASTQDGPVGIGVATFSKNIAIAFFETR